MTYLSTHPDIRRFVRADVHIDVGVPEQVNRVCDGDAPQWRAS